MIDISKWAFENKKLIYFLIAVLIVGGAYSSYEMSKLEDPEITVKLAMVVTTYPGAVKMAGVSLIPKTAE